MGQFFGQEKITKLFKFSNAIATLPAGAIIKIGGQSYSNSDTINCNTSTSGFGGIDTGSIAPSTLYYVYTVIESGVLGLVASISAVSPTGYTSHRKVGAFTTNGSSEISKVFYFDERDASRTVFKARKSGAQSIANVANTKVSWQTIDLDSESGWDSINNRYVVQFAGTYNINASVNYVANAGGVGGRAAYLRVNNSEVGFTWIHRTNGSYELTVPLERISIDLVPGDYIEVYAQHDSGAAINVQANNGTIFEISKDGSSQPDWSL